MIKVKLELENAQECIKHLNSQVGVKLTGRFECLIVMKASAEEMS